MLSPRILTLRTQGLDVFLSSRHKQTGRSPGKGRLSSPDSPLSGQLMDVREETIIEQTEEH